ncbi:MAG: PIN domain-containing protein [archaeon]
MKIVLDANILFSALIKDSITRKIILEYDGRFLFPEYIFDEMRKHQDELYHKTGLEENEFRKLFSLLMEKMTIIANHDTHPHQSDARAIAAPIDPDDALFFACALAHPGSIIWSDDKALKKQTKIVVWNTSELIQLMKTER